MKNLGISIVVLAVVASMAAAQPPDEALREDPASRVERVDPAEQPGSSSSEIDPGASEDQSQLSQSEAEEVDAELSGFAEGRVYVEEPFDCSYCPGCAGSLVNKACCFHGDGNFFCVSSCSSGCAGPVLPELE
jgi:hypothetical protein